MGVDGKYKQNIRKGRKRVLGREYEEGEQDRSVNLLGGWLHVRMLGTWVTRC